MTDALRKPNFSQIDANRAKLDGVVSSTPAPAVCAQDGVILECASGITPEAVNWLWNGWLALGKFHVLAGPPGQGKTTIALAAMATLTTGGTWPDGSDCQVGNVLMWSGEDDPKDTLLPRLLGMGADPSRVFFIQGTRIDGKAEPFDPARDLGGLLQEAQRIGGVRLLIVDPVVSAVAGDSHKNGEVRRGLQPLVDLARAVECAVVGISHFSKGSGGRDPVERVTGSLAFGALARVVLCAVKKQDAEDDRRIFARAKSNIGPDGGAFEYSIEQTDLAGFPGVSASTIRWGAAISGAARDLLAEAETVDDEAASATDDAAAYLRDLLKGQEFTPSRDVMRQMKAEGYSDKVIRCAREKLGVLVRRQGFGAAMQSRWSLPVLPSSAQLCPVVPAPNAGQEWAGMEQKGMTEDAERF